MKMEFIIDIREVYTTSVEVEADSFAEAVRKVKEGEGTYLDNTLSYSHTLDHDTWKGYDDKGEFYDTL